MTSLSRLPVKMPSGWYKGSTQGYEIKIQMIGQAADLDKGASHPQKRGYVLKQNRAM